MGGHLLPINRTCDCPLHRQRMDTPESSVGDSSLSTSHTGELATELEDMLNAWNLSVVQLSAATTDNAANIRSASHGDAGVGTLLLL